MFFYHSQLVKPVNGYAGDKQQLRIQVEWDETLLLFQATYHKYDDVGRVHNYQMRWGQVFIFIFIFICLFNG